MNVDIVKETKRARVHSAETACAAWRVAWATGPGFCYDTPEWEAYDAAQDAHLRFFRLPHGAWWNR